jgi:hypothetical protein
MPNWGMALLFVFVGLGVGPTSSRTAMKLVVWVTTIVLAAVFVSYHALR